MTPPERLTLKSIASDFLRDFSQAEKGLWGTIVQLTLRPRRVINTFLFKDRQQFSRPTRYLIFCLSILAIQLITKEWRYGNEAIIESMVDSEGKTEAEGPVSAFAQGLADGASNVDPAGVKALTPYSGYLLAIMIPVFAFLYYFLFPDRGLNYAENLAVATYLHSHWILLLALASFLFLFFPDVSNYATARKWAKTGTILFLVVLVLRTFITSSKGFFRLLLKLILALPWLIFPLAAIGSALSFAISKANANADGIPPVAMFLILMAIGTFGTWFFGRSLVRFREGWPGVWPALPILLWSGGLWGLLGFRVLAELSA